MDSTEKLIVLIDARETVFKSWARDAVSFGGLLGTAYALNVLMPPSGWLNAALGFSWIVWLAGKSVSHRANMTPDEARAWLDQHAPSPKDATL